MPEIIAPERRDDPGANQAVVRVVTSIAYAQSVVLLGFAVAADLAGDATRRDRWAYPIMAVCCALLARRMAKRPSSGAALLLLLLSLAFVATFGVHFATVGSAMIMAGIYGQACYVLNDSSND